MKQICHISLANHGAVLKKRKIFSSRSSFFTSIGLYRVSVVWKENNDDDDDDDDEKRCVFSLSHS